MSKGDHDGLYVDTGLLREHVSTLQREKKLASSLYEHVALMKGVADPAVAYRYDAVLRDIEQMIEYFEKMAKLLANIDDEAVQLSHELRGIIKDSTEVAERTVAEKFVL